MSPAPEDAVTGGIPILVNPGTAPAGATATPGPGQAAVRRDTIADVLTLSGRIAGADETVLTFGASGQVNAVDVKAGDKVQPGDVLIETDSQELKRQLLQAQGELETASIRLEQARAQAAADAAAREQNASQQARDGAAQRQTVVGDAEAILHRAQASLDKVQAGPSDSDVRAAQAAVTTAQAAVDRAQTDMDRLRHGPDPAQVRAAQVQVDAAQADVEKQQAALDALRRGADPAAIRTAQRDVDRATASLKAAEAIPIDPKDPHVDKARADKDAAVASAQAAVQDAQDKLDGLKLPPNAADVSVARGVLESAKNKLDAAKQAFSDLQAGPDQNALDQAQAVIANAQLNLQNAQDHLADVMSHPTPAELQTAHDQVKAAQAALNRANTVGTSSGAPSGSNVSTAYNLVLLEKDVARGQALVTSLQQDLEASRVTAPFAGVVTRVQVHIHDKLTRDTPVVTLAKSDLAIVQVDASAADRGRVAPGQSATVKLDGVDSPLTAKVADVQDAARGASGKSLRLDVDWRADSPGYGSVVQVQVEVNRKADALLVPKKAVHTAGGRRYVQVQTPTGRKIVNVEVGIVSGDNAEIVSGVTQGQIVYVGP